MIGRLELVEVRHRRGEVDVASRCLFGHELLDVDSAVSDGGRSDAGDEALHWDTARWIARLRAGPEAREGLTAFLERRKPGWIRES